MRYAYESRSDGSISFYWVLSIVVIIDNVVQQVRSGRKETEYDKGVKGVEKKNGIKQLARENNCSKNNQVFYPLVNAQSACINQHSLSSHVSCIIQYFLIS